MKKQRERRKGEEGRSLTSTFNEAMMRPVCLEDDDECMVYVLYSRLGKTMQKGTKLVCRKTLTRHLINRQEGTFSQPIFPGL